MTAMCYLAWSGAIINGYLATDVPDDARRYAAAIDAAIARGRCPTGSVRLCDLGEPPNCVPRCCHAAPRRRAARRRPVPHRQVPLRGLLLGNALIHGRTDQFDANLGFLARYPDFPIARLWFDGLSAVRKVIDGDDLDERELQSLATYTVVRTDRRPAVARPAPRCPSAGATWPVE